MVINITLGFVTGFVALVRSVPGRVTPDAACAFVCAGLVGASCANAVDPAVRVITTANQSPEKQRANKRAERKCERRPDMRLLWRRLLLVRAPRLLIRFRRESLRGQSLG
jgi:hypothetical protein